MGKGIGRSQLRSRLLIGVAAVAIAAPLAGKAFGQAVPADKWQPFVELGGAGGSNFSFGDVDIFVPLWHDQSSLLFGDLRGTFTTQTSQEGNIGIGYRILIDPEWILGGWVFFDIKNSRNDNLFYQASVGAELPSVDWDFRINRYFPINTDSKNINNNNGTL